MERTILSMLAITHTSNTTITTILSGNVVESGTFVLQLRDDNSQQSEIIVPTQDIIPDRTIMLRLRDVSRKFQEPLELPASLRLRLEECRRRQEQQSVLCSKFNKLTLIMNKFRFNFKVLFQMFKILYIILLQVIQPGRN